MYVCVLTAKLEAVQISQYVAMLYFQYNSGVCLIYQGFIRAPSLSPSLV